MDNLLSYSALEPMGEFGSLVRFPKVSSLSHSTTLQPRVIPPDLLVISHVFRVFSVVFSPGDPSQMERIMPWLQVRRDGQSCPQLRENRPTGCISSSCWEGLKEKRMAYRYIGPRSSQRRRDISALHCSRDFYHSSQPVIFSATF